VALAGNFAGSVRVAGGNLAYSLSLAAMTATVTVPLAWCLARLSQRGAPGQALTAGVAGMLLALPGPVLGIGLSLALSRPTAWWGHENPTLWRIADALAAVADSRAVLVWLLTLRTLPFAVLVLWPAVRLVQRSVLEAAELDGAGWSGRLWHVELPSCWPAVAAAVLITIVLSLGEVGGSIVVAPPGPQPLSVRIQTLAHQGVENSLAGICLVLLVAATITALAALTILTKAFGIGRRDMLGQ
jgi:iron(III) transport system permease protein